MELARVTAETVATQALADEYEAAWNSRDVDAIASLHTDGSIFQLHAGDGAEVRGRDAIRETFAGFPAQFPDLHSAGQRLQVGPRHLVFESRMTGIAASPLVVAGREAEAAGAKVVIDCVDVIELRDGLVARKDTYLDATALLGDAQGS